MRKLFVFLGAVFLTAGSVVSAQEVDSMAPLQKSSWGDAKTSEIVDYIPEISLDMRGGYKAGSTYGAGCFTGDDFNIDINGKISPSLSYSFNHRIASSYYGEASGFDATNWLTLTYEVGDFAFTAGKDALLMGSFEYDAYDLDAYYDMNSAFFNILECWQWGASAAWYPSDSHELVFQVANSPFSFGDPGVFSYAAAWRGSWDNYESYWSLNMWEAATGPYVKSINLGNRFMFGGFTCDLDYTTRAIDLSLLGTHDFSLLLMPSYQFGESVRVFAKLGYEGMRIDFGIEDYTGRNLLYGAGVEYFPLKENKDVRVHATYVHNDFMIGDLFNIGLTWKMNLTKAVRSLF
jgi:hypothetical protein